MVSPTEKLEFIHRLNSNTVIWIVVYSFLFQDDDVYDCLQQ